jgi:hypothetical protein
VDDSRQNATFTLFFRFLNAAVAAREQGDVRINSSLKLWSCAQQGLSDHFEIPRAGRVNLANQVTLKGVKMANVQTMKLVSQYTTIWRQCWHPEICINIPFDGRKCLGADVCVAIVEDGGTFYIEGSINGNTARYALTAACIPVYSVGIASLEVCVTNLDVSNGNLNSLTLSVKGCIGGSIAGIHLQQCWDLFNQTIKFHSFTADEIVKIAGLDVDRALLNGPSWDRKFVTSATAVLDADFSHCKCSGD